MSQRRDIDFIFEFIDRNYSSYHRLNLVLYRSRLTQKLFSTFEAELSDTMPIVHTSINGCRIIGRLTTGNRKGLLVPQNTTDQELQVCSDLLFSTLTIHSIYAIHYRTR